MRNISYKSGVWRWVVFLRHRWLIYSCLTKRLIPYLIWILIHFFPDIIWYKRYLDDIFLGFFLDKNVLPEFVNWVNDIQPIIKFSYQSSEQAISFLDMVVYKKNKKLAVWVFRKSTDQNTLLHFNSNHPWHLKTNLPYGQFLRMQHNCTDESTFQYESKTLAKQLSDWGYPSKIIDSAWKRASQRDTQQLLQNKQETIPEKHITCAFQFNVHCVQIKWILNRFWHIVSHILGCQLTPLMGYRCARNIRDVLIRSDFNCQLESTIKENIVKGHYKCHKCSVCGNCLEVKGFSCEPYELYTISYVYLFK